LAFNRCLELLSPTFADHLFAGYRIYIWLSLSSLYAFYWFLFGKPLLFSGLYFAWHFDPFVGYRENSQGLVGIFFEDINFLKLLPNNSSKHGCSPSTIRRLPSASRSSTSSSQLHSNCNRVAGPPGIFLAFRRWFARHKRNFGMHQF
jgi:hypothetical protein